MVTVCPTHHRTLSFRTIIGSLGWSWTHPATTHAGPSIGDIRLNAKAPVLVGRANISVTTKVCQFILTQCSNWDITLIGCSKKHTAVMLLWLTFWIMFSFLLRMYALAADPLTQNSVSEREISHTHAIDNSIEYACLSGGYVCVQGNLQHNFS